VKSSKFFATAHASTPPLPGYSTSKKQFSAETMLFYRKNVYFSQKIHYKHGNLKYLNNFHTFLGLEKAKFDSLSHFLKYM
jgi:hypothetical protein